MHWQPPPSANQTRGRRLRAEAPSWPPATTMGAPPHRTADLQESLVETPLPGTGSDRGVATSGGANIVENDVHAAIAGQNLPVHESRGVGQKEERERAYILGFAKSW